MVDYYEVIGADDDGNQYRLNIKQVIRDDLGCSLVLLVELPFGPDHKIWKELYNE